MLQVNQSVHNVFQLIIANNIKLLPNSIYKNPGFTQAFLQKSLKLVSYDKNEVLSIEFSLMLLPAIYSLVYEITTGKGSLVKACNLTYGKIILVLLDEVIIVHMRLTFINIRLSRLKKFFGPKLEGFGFTTVYKLFCNSYFKYFRTQMVRSIRNRDN